MSGSDPYEYDDFDFSPDDERAAEEAMLDECGLHTDGQCGLAGAEHCDFVCPMRNSDQFCGSAAWRKKHARKKR